MLFSNVLVASVVAPLVAAHGGIPGAPKIFGLPSDLKARAPTVPRILRHPAELKRDMLETRQGGQNGRCGPSFGSASCASGFCCSGAVSYSKLIRLQIADVNRVTVVQPKNTAMPPTV
jgi:hypothetical protein